MRHAAAVGSFPLLQQGATLATAEGLESNGAAGSCPNSLSSSSTNSGSSSDSKEDTHARLPEGESCSSCWEGNNNFFLDSKIYHTYTASSELLQLPQQQHAQPLQERRLQQGPQQQQRFHQEVQRRPQKYEQERQQAPPVCGRTQRKQQPKQLQKQHHSFTVEAGVPNGICGNNIHDAQANTSDGGKTSSSTRGRSRGSSRANASSGTIEESNNSSKKQSDAAESAGTECLTTPQKELQVTADYSLVSRGLVDMTYMQLEAARPQEELPPPDVGDIVESKAAHPDAQIFKAKVLDRWRDPEHLWMFKLRSPEMAAPYLEPLKRKSRRCASSLQQQHNAARSSSCTPNACSGRATALSSGSKPSDLGQVTTGGCASASAPAACGSAPASKKNQPHRSAGPTTATAGPRAAAKTAATAAACAAEDEGNQEAPSSPYLQRPVGEAAASSSTAVETHLAAGKGPSASSSAAVAASSPGCSPAAGVSLSPPSADRCSVRASLCRRAHPPQRAASNSVSSRGAVVGTDVGSAASRPLLCQPPTAAAVVVPLGNATVTPSTAGGSHVADADRFPAASPAVPVACAAQSPCAVLPAAATVAAGQQAPASATARPPQPVVQPVAPQGSIALHGTPSVAKPTPAMAAATELAAGGLPAAASALAPAFEESSLFNRQLAGCTAAGTPQQDACKPLSYSALVPELYLSPAPPTEAAPATAVTEEKEEARENNLLRKFLNSAVPSVAPALTSSSPDKTSGTISGASTTTPAASGSQQLAAVERRCSSPAELSLQFMSPSLEPARTIAAGGAAPDVRNGAKAVHPAAALSLGAATARKSWPARAELLLKDGIGLHQQRLQRLLLAAAASAAARESDQELERLAPSQPQQQQQQEPTQHQAEEVQAEQDVSEKSAGGAATFLTPSPGDVNGVNGCCFASSAAAASDGAKKIEESSSSSQTSAVAALQVPNGAGGWMKAFPSTEADPGILSPHLLHDMHPQPSHQKPQQPQHLQQLHEQQGHQQQQVQQQQQVTTSDSMDEAELYARHLMKPRRSLPAYQRLERMLFLKQLVPLSRTNSVPSFRFSHAAVPCASPLVANDAAATAPAAVAPAAGAAVTSASSPVSATGGFAAVAGGIGEKGEGRDSPTVEAAVAEPRAPAEVGTAAASTGGAAAARTERIFTATAAEGSIVNDVIQRSEATAATSVAASADMAAGVPPADATASGPQKALPDTKKVRRSSCHVGIGSDASIKTDSSVLGSAIEVVNRSQVKERLACVEQQHAILLSADRKTRLSCCPGSNSPSNSSSSCGSKLSSSSNSSSRKGSECASEERCGESTDYSGRSSSTILEHCSFSRDARSSSKSGCCSSKSGTSPISREGGTNSSARSSSNSNSNGDMEWEIEGSGKTAAVEDPAGLPCSLLRISSSCCSGAVSVKEKLHQKNSGNFSAATVVTTGLHHAKHQLQQREPQP